MKTKLFELRKFQRFLVIVLSIIFLIYTNGCNEEDTPSLFERVQPTPEPPVITGFVPQNFALSGVTKITVNGTNFSEAPEKNMLSFGVGNSFKWMGEVVQASKTQLIVITPLIEFPDDSLGIDVNVKLATESDKFSNVMSYRLEAAVRELQVTPNRKYFALAVDAAGNIFASITDGASADKGFLKIGPDGTESEFAPKGAAPFRSLKMGPNNILYGARNVRAVFKIEEGISAKPFATFPTGSSIIDFDFDPDMNIWAGGKGSDKLFRVNPSAEVKEFDFAGDVRSVRVFNSGDGNYLYAAVNRENIEKIYRMKIISSDSLGSEEEYFNFSSAIAAGSEEIPIAITFSVDGDLFIGGDGDAPIMVVHPDKSFENLHSFLLGVSTIYDPTLFSMAWGITDELFYIRLNKTDLSQEIVGIRTEKLSAPYYGRGN